MNETFHYIIADSGALKSDCADMQDDQELHFLHLSKVMCNASHFIVLVLMLKCSVSGSRDVWTIQGFSNITGKIILISSSTYNL